jgi:hypothetical protein
MVAEPNAEIDLDVIEQEVLGAALGSASEAFGHPGFAEYGESS